MAVQWTTNKFKGWVNDQRLSPLLKLHGKFTDLSDTTKARFASEVVRSTLALGRQLIKAELCEVQLNDGPISYWKTNNPHKETVMFIHGFGDSKDGCYPFAMHLTRNFNMLAFDLPGFGQSFKNLDLEYNFTSYASWMEEFMEKAKIGPVHLIGNSLGGAMAMKLAQIRPDLVKTLTLIDTAAVIDERYDSAYDDFIKGKVLFQVKSREDFDNFWKMVFHKPPFLPIFMKDHIYEQFRLNYELYGRFILDTFRNIKSRLDPSLNDLFMNNALGEMKMPIHIMWGDQDKLFPLSYGQRAHELVKGSRFTVLKNIGHAPQVEAPHQTAKHVKNFIDEQLKLLGKSERQANGKTDTIKKKKKVPEPKPKAKTKPKTKAASKKAAPKKKKLSKKVK